MRYFLLLFIVFTNVCYSQNSDSLTLLNTKLQDTVRVKAGLVFCNTLLQRNDSTAIFFITKCEAICNAKNKNLLGQILVAKGSYYIVFGDYVNAIKQLYKAERILKAVSINNKELFHVYSAFGQLYIYDNKTNLSINYLTKAIDVLSAQRRLDTLAYIKANYTLGTTFSTIDINKSLSYYLKAHNLAVVFGNKYALSATNSGLASAYKNIGSANKDIVTLKKALPYAYKSIQILNELKLYNKLPYSLSTLGYTYDLLDKLDSAIKYHKLALVLHEKNGEAAKMQEIYKALGYCFAQQNNFKEAYTYFDNYIDINNTLYNENRTNEIDNLSAKYETEKKEAEIKTLSQEQQITALQSKRKSILIYSIIGLAIALAIAGYFIFARYKIKKQNELLRVQLLEANKTNEAEKKAAESELKALKSQMNPHFIFNALNSIQEQFMYGDKLIANEQMGNFTYLTRQILSVSGKKKITLNVETEILTKYLELEKMRFNTNFEFAITIGSTIDEDYHQLPPMLIQPFVENSIKHGLMHKEGSKKISIHFELSQNEDYIVCTVIDNGIGREKSAAIKSQSVSAHSSFSITAIEQRLQLLNTNLQLAQLINYTDVLTNNKVEGTKVEIFIPLI